MDNTVLLTLEDDGKNFSFESSIETELEHAKLKLDEMNETINSIKQLKPECDKLDYALAISSGALCGIFDIFLVGSPKDSKLMSITDEWFENRVKDFAKFTGWGGGEDNSASSAIRFLEKEFKIPYDQRGAGDAGKAVFDLSPSNHHFKSLGHHPSLVGLFFSVLDQFTNKSHFVTEGEVLSLQQADSSFQLKGNSVPGKLFCGVVNWFGHLMSDVSGSSGSKGRGMGVPSPLWSWTNDIIVLKSQLGISRTELDKYMSELALEIYKEGYEARFQMTQAIPVLVNELIVRLFYSVRRLIKFFSKTNVEKRTFKSAWESCDPFSNATVKRMLTAAHGTFCLVDLGDAAFRSYVPVGNLLNIPEFVMRVNVVGLGRFTISLYGETKTAIQYHHKDLNYRLREKEILEYYIEGLQMLSETYNHQLLETFIHDLTNSAAYKEAFESSVQLAKTRHVDEGKIIHSKSEGDNYFKGIK